MTMPYPVPDDLAQWAADMEAVGELPASDTPGLEAWGAAEGGSFKNDAYANVLNTTKTLPGVNSSGTGTQGDIQNFAIPGQTQEQDWMDGITADLATINQTNMNAISGSLKSGNPETLPSALASDPWGTNPQLVAEILGQTPDQIAALSNQTSGTSSGGGGVVTAGGSGDQLTSLSSALGGTAAGFFGISAGSHIMVRGAFALFGLILLIIALKEMFNPASPAATVLNIPGQAKTVVKSTAKRVGEAGAIAA
jgi:hypothetical protein